jgi:hypothetical protein
MKMWPGCSDVPDESERCYVRDADQAFSVQETAVIGGTHLRSRSERGVRDSVR